MRVSRVRGFTLIEVLVVLGIAALLLAVALPDLRPQVAQQRASALAGDMADALRYARQYALNTSGLVTFTPNGCGYSVTDSGGTQLLSGPSTAPTGVSCQAVSNALSFLGDGSVSICSQSGGTTTCTVPTANQNASISAGALSWQVSVSPGGVITTNAP